MLYLPEGSFSPFLCHTCFIYSLSDDQSHGVKKHEVFLVYIDNDVDAPENVIHASQSHRGYFKHRADLILKKSRLLANEDEQLARIFKLMEPVHGS